MKTKIISLFLLFFGLFSTINAQDDSKIRVKGVIIDDSTRQPIAFANLGLLGTMAGAASDIDGQFELNIPGLYATHVVRVTAVGYASREYKLYELRDMDTVVISLTPVTYSIADVRVTAESLVLQKMLQDVVANIPRNYIPRPYNYEGYFEHRVTRGDSTPAVKEAIVNLYDADGYHRSNPEQTFRDLNYTFTQARRTGMNGTLADDLVYFDDILTADIARHTRNILDIANLPDFKLTSRGRLLHDGDSVQVIAYECTRPTLSNTGTANVTRYSGEIYIDLTRLAVIRNTLRVTSSAYNPLGRDILLCGDAPRHEVATTITTSYKKVSSYYFLSGASIVYTYLDGATRVKGEMQYQTTRVRVNTPTPVSGRTYIERLPTDTDFWDRYTIYLDAEE